MSAGAAILAPQTVGSEAGVRPGWIQSPAFDLALFTLAPLSGLLVVAAAQVPGGGRLGILAMFLVAIPHYLSSFSFYLGDDNRAHYRKRRLAFFAGPVAIFALVAALRLGGIHTPVQNAMFVWNIWHVALQSAGILAIYRHLNGGPAEERLTARNAILFTNAAMALWYVERYPPLHGWLVAAHPLAPAVTRLALVALAVYWLVALAVRLARRPQPVSLAEGAFLATSLLLFHPYLWVPQMDQATFAMLMGHFIQYLAIVWLLNHRKYSRAEGSTTQRLLGSISARPASVALFMVVVGLTFWAAERATAALGLAMVYVIVWNAMTLIHFYIDGLVWAFRQPHVRQTVGPYLMSAERVAPR